MHLISKKEKIRLNLDLTPEAKAHIELVQKKARGVTMIELVRKSMALLELVLDHQASGGKIILENADGSREALRLL